LSSVFEALERLADLVAKTPEPRVLLEASLEAVCGPVGVGRGGIFMRRAGSHEVALEVERGLPPQVVHRCGRQPVAAKGTGVVGRSAYAAAPSVIKDLAKEPAAAELRAAFREAGVEVHSAAAVPVVINGKVIGVILVLSEPAREFFPAEVSYLRLVGTLFGATLVGQEALREHAKTNDELKALTGALEQRTAELKELDRYKTNMIHVITHELRKPLSPIFTYADMLLGMDFPPDKQKQFLTQIRAAADDMNHYITDMINAAKLEEGGVQLLYTDVDVLEVVKMSASKFNAEAEAAHIQVDVQAELSRRKFTTDGVKIGEIVENLLENAIKYTPQGGRVVLGVRDGGGAVEISVKDTGIGIAPREIPTLFNKFQIVANAALPRPVHRAGLGLYLTKVYADALGGTIAVESQLGKGSTFTLRVPVGG
jgi:signal transduction histidine kinase